MGSGYEEQWIYSDRLRDITIKLNLMFLNITYKNEYIITLYYIVLVFFNYAFYETVCEKC